MLAMPNTHTCTQRYIDIHTHAQAQQSLLLRVTKRPFKHFEVGDAISDSDASCAALLFLTYLRWLGVEAGGGTRALEQILRV